MQLVIDLSMSDYTFAHKLYELQRSEFFSPLAQLSIMNDNMSNSYFAQAKAYIDANTKQKGEDYDQSTTFEEVNSIYDKFVASLSTELNFKESSDDGPKVELMNDEITKLGQIKKTFINDKQTKWSLKGKYSTGVYYR